MMILHFSLLPSLFISMCYIDASTCISFIRCIDHPFTVLQHNSDSSPSTYSSCAILHFPHKTQLLVYVMKLLIRLQKRTTVARKV